MKVFKSLFAIVAVAVVMFTSACVDDNLIKNDIGSTLQTHEGKRVSTFYLPISDTKVDKLPLSVLIALDNSKTDIVEYNGRIAVEKERLKVDMEIPADHKIADGQYCIICYDAASRDILLRYFVNIKSEMVHLVVAEMVDYQFFDSSGTKDDPHIISEPDSFDALLYNISKVDTSLRGAGRYFKQTASFDAPKAGEDADGREYASFPFAGNYDGGGYTITNLNYYGNNDPVRDSNIGLFDGLLEGAVVKNLKVEASIQGVYNNAGVIAGYTQGNVTIENVTVTGKLDNCGGNSGGLVGVSDGNLTITNVKSEVDVASKPTIYVSALGGVVGNVNSGAVSISNLKMGGDIKANNRVGGVIGYCNDKTKITISNVSVNDGNFSMKGEKYVGGIIGEFAGESFNIDSVKLSHTVTSADSDLRSILARGDEGAYAGGVIGYISQLSAESYVKNTLIECPIEGTKVVGGLIGYSHIASDSATLHIENSSVASIVIGDNIAGGFVGCFDQAGQLNFSGKCNVMVMEEGTVDVRGRDCVGGMIGVISTPNALSVDNQSSIHISTNVSGRELVGGLVGDMTNNTFEVERITTDTALVVRGTKYVGGLVGRAQKSRIYGRNYFTLTGAASIPKFTSTPDFRGVVQPIEGASDYFGGAVGYAHNSYLAQLAVQSTITCTELEFVGGVVGRYDTNDDYFSMQEDKVTIDHCYFNGSVTGEKNVGGIAGYKYNDGWMQYCINYGEVNATENVGGVLGKLDYNDISHSGGLVYYCVNVGSVTGSTDVGGVVGYMAGDNDNDKYAEIKRCANYGKVSNSGKEGAGGILGRCNTRRGRVLHCANHGEVFTSESCRIGGVVGSMGRDGDVDESTNLQVAYCANAGNVKSDHSGSRIGGVLGYQEEGNVDYNDHDSWFHDCYNTGIVTKTGSNSEIGGILGKADNYSYIQKNFNYGKVNDGSGYAIVGGRVSDFTTVFDDDNYYISGTGKTQGNWFEETSISQDDIMKKEKYDGFAFDSIWVMGPVHPILIDCPFQDVTYDK